jgi:hypothetical protein
VGVGPALTDNGGQGSAAAKEDQGAGGADAGKKPSPPVDLTSETIEQLLQRDLAAIQAKVEAGKPLTDAEVRRLREAATRKDTPAAQVASPSDPMWVPNLSALADALGCDRRTLQRLLKLEGNPGKREDGSYSLTAWKLWAIEHSRLKKQVSTPDKNELECRALLLRNEKLEVENAERRGELMHVDEVTRVLTEMVGAFVQGLRGLKHTLSPQVVGVPVGEAAKRIGREIDEHLTRLALGEWAKKKVFWSVVYAHLLDLRRSFSLGAGLNAT